MPITQRWPRVQTQNTRRIGIWMYDSIGSDGKPLDLSSHHRVWFSTPHDLVFKMEAYRYTSLQLECRRAQYHSNTKSPIQ
jgi:hypothetical protein